MTSSDQLTLFVAASPASPGASPDSSEAPTTTVISGRKCCELLPLLGLDGCLARMSAALFRTRWASTEFSLTWKLSATPARRSVFRLVPSMRRTSGSACGSWPTPQTHDARPGHPERIGRFGETGKRPGGRDLTDWAAAATWATPSGQLHNDGESPESFFARREKLAAKGINGNGAGTPLPVQAKAVWATPSVPNGGRKPKGGMSPTGITEEGAKRQVGLHNQTEWATGATPNGSGASSTSAGGALNPAFVCWLQGYPAGWLD